MNKVFKVIWSQATQAWVAVSELTSAKGKTKSSVGQVEQVDSLTTAVAGNFHLTKVTLATLVALFGFVGTANADWLAINRGSGVAGYAGYDNSGNSVIFAQTSGSGEAVSNNNNGKDKRVIIGVNSTYAALENSVAIGDSAKVLGNPYGLNGLSNDGQAQGVAIGSTVSAAGQAVAMGNNSYAVGRASIAIGNDDNSAYYDYVVSEYDYAKYFGGLYNSVDSNGGTYGFAGKQVTTTETIGGTQITGQHWKASGGTTGNRKYSVTLAQGHGSIALGSRSLAYADGSTALGTLALALDKGATAIGTLSRAEGVGATAIGRETRVFAKNAISAGNENQVLKEGGASYGFRARTGGESAVAIGTDVYANAMMTAPTAATSTEIKTTAEKAGTKDFAAYVASLETETKKDSTINPTLRQMNGVGDANGKNGVVQNSKIGNGDTSNAIVIGTRSAAVGSNSLVLGRGAFATQNNSFAIGSYSRADAENAIAFGLASRALGTGAMAMGVGTGTDADSQNSTAIGSGSSIQDADNATLLGSNTYISNGNRAMALGANSTVSGYGNVSVGNDNKVYNKGTSDEGTGTVANYDANVEGRKGSVTRHNSIFGNSIQVGIGVRNSIFIGRNARGGKLGNDGNVNSTHENNFTDSIALGNDAKVYAKDNANVSSNDNYLHNANSTMALGTLAEATLQNSVALGVNSKTDYSYADLNKAGWVMPGAISVPTSGKVGVISVGYKGYERRIVNVASGYRNTDAVNVAQLKTMQEKFQMDIDRLGKGAVSFLSVDKTVAGGDGYRMANIANKGANYQEYVNLLALQKTIKAREVLNAETFDSSAKSKIDNRITELETANSSFATTASDLKNYTVPTTGDYSDVYSQIENKQNTAAARSVLTGDEQAQLESSNYNNSGAKGKDSIAIGYSALVQGGSYNAIAIGHRSKIDGNDNVEAVAIGASASTGIINRSSGKYAVALGSSAGAASEYSIAIGKGAMTGVVKTFGTKDGSKFVDGFEKADKGVAIGNEARAIGESSIAIGNKAKTGIATLSADGNDAAAKSANNAVAIGNGAEATIANSVAIGGSSKAEQVTIDDTARKFVTKTDANADQNNNYAGIYNTASGTFAVGKSGSERIITHVAAGRISPTSTDAVNGSQLYQVANNVGFNITQDGLAKSRINNNGIVNFTKGDFTTASVTDNGNNSNVKFDVVTQSISWVNGKNEVQATGDAGVAKSADVVSMMNKALGLSIAFFADQGKDANTGASVLRKLGDTVQFKTDDRWGTGADRFGGDNIQFQHNGNGVFVLGLKHQPVFNKITFSKNDDLTSPTGPAIDSTGIAMGNTKITGLQAGTADTDGVNVSQLKDYAKKDASNLDANNVTAWKNKLGVSNLDLTYKANNGANKTTSLSNGLNFSDGTNTTAAVDNNGVVKFNLNPALTGITSIAGGAGKPTITFNQGNVGFGNAKLTGVAEGTADTDAVNKGQLDKAITNVSNVANNAADKNLSNISDAAKNTIKGLVKVEGKDGISVTPTADGSATKYTVALDAATKGKVDNAADKDLSNLTQNGKNVVKDQARGAVEVKSAAGDDNIATVTPSKDENAHKDTYTVSVSKAAITTVAKEAAKSAVVVEAVANSGATVTPADENGVKKYKVGLDGTKIKDLAGTTNLATEYAKADASNLTNDNVTSWKNKLGVSNIDLTYKANGTGNQKTTLSQGLNFTSSDLEIQAKANGEVAFALKQDAKNAARDLVDVTKADNDEIISVTKTTDTATNKNTFKVAADANKIKDLSRGAVEVKQSDDADNIATVTSSKDAATHKDTYTVKVSKDSIKDAAGEGVKVKSANSNITVDSTAKDHVTTNTLTLAKDLTGIDSIEGAAGKAKITLNDNVVVNGKKVTGLAEGEISDNSTDAVTGKQLKATKDDITKITTNITNLTSGGLKFAGDRASTAGGTNEITTELGGKLTIDGEGNFDSSVANSSAADNIDVVADSANKKLTVKLAKALKNIETIGLSKDGKNGTIGIDADGNITYKNGDNKESKIVTEKTIGNQSISYTANSARDKKSVTLNNGFNFTDDTNTTAEVSNDGVVKFKLNKDLTGVTSIEGETGKAKVTLGDTVSVNNKKITGLADATIDANSTDAVTGKQLNKAKEDLTQQINNINTAVTGGKLTFTGNKTSETIDRKLNETLTIKGEQDADQTIVSAKNNIDVVKENNDLVVKLNKDLRNLTSAGNADTAKVTFGTDKTVSITADDKAAKFAKVTGEDGLALTGLTARDRNSANYGTGDNAKRAATEGALKELVTTLGLDGANGNNGTGGNTGPAGKDGLNGKSIIEKVDGLRDGTAGPVVYTDAEGNRLIKDKTDGKYYKVGADGNKEGNPIADNDVRHSLVNVNGETKDNPSILSNVGSTLGIEGKTASTAITADTAKTKAGELLTKAGKDLSNVATLGELQAVAQAGLDFGADNKDGDKQVVVHRALGNKLDIKGELTDGTTLTDTAKDNITVQANKDTNTLTVKLAANLANIQSIANGEGAKIALNKDTKNVVITADGKGLTIAKSGDGVALTGLEARTTASNQYGEGDNANRAATEAAVKAIADNAGTANQIAGDGKDGRDGKDGTTAGSAGSHGATGKDGLNGKDLTEKVNALRNGEAGIVVYTDEAGNRLVKGNDGNYYAKDDIDDKGAPKAGKTAKTPVTASLVNPNGDTANAPTKLGNVAHSIAPADITADNAKTAVTDLAAKADGLNTVATAGDLKTIALAGLDFTGNKTDAKVHRNLGQTLTIKGEQDAGQTITSAKNNIDVVKEGDDLVVKLNKNLQNIETIGLSKDGKNGTIGIDGDGNITYKKDGDTNASKIVTEQTIGNQSISYRANSARDRKSVTLNNGLDFKDGTNTTAEVDNDGVVKFNLNKDLTGLKSAQFTKTDGTTNTIKIDGDAQSITGLEARDRNSDNYGVDKGDVKNSTRAATEGALKELVTTLGLDGNKGNNGADGNNTTGPAGKDGLNGKSIIEKVDGLRDGVAGPVVYTDAEGNRLVKKDGKYYKASDLQADGTLNAGATEVTDVRHSLVNVNGETKDAPSILSNAGSTLGIEGKTTSKAIDEATAKTKTAALLTKEKTDLSNVATLGELQAVAQAGLDFAGNDESNIHRALGTKLDIVGEGVNKDKSTTFASASGNINVVKDTTAGSNKLIVKLAKDLQNIQTITLTNGKDGQDGKSVTLGVNDNGNLTIKDPASKDANAQPKEIATKDDLKDSVDNVVLNVTADKATADGEASKATVNLKTQTLALNGTADEIVATAENQGVTFKLADKVKTDIANALAGKGIAADGKDGKDGAAGNAGANGLTGKDGLNGKDLTTKVNALRNGEAGPVVYTDAAGNRLVKANDGKYYPADKVNEDGSTKDGATAEANPIASVVNPDGTTTKPTVLGNLAHSIMPTDVTADNAGAAVTGSGNPATGGLLQKTGDDLKHAATVGDLKTIALAGLDFNGNNSDTKVHRNLGTQLAIEGEGVTKEASATFASASGNINVVGEEGKLTVKLNKNLQNIETIGLSKDGKNGTIGIDGDGNITYKKDGDNKESKIVTEQTIGNQSISYTANGTADKKSVKLKDGFNFTNDTNTTAEVDNDGVVKFKLNDTLTGINSIANGDANIALNKDAKNVVITADGKGLTIAKDTNGVALTGLEARDRNSDNYGVDKDNVKNSTRAATEGALKELADTLGLNGNNGKDGNTSTGPAGKDGLDGKSIIEKVDGLRNGIAGPVVYTDENGNRLVKGKDGKYYQKDDLNDQGMPKDGKSAVATPIASLVNPNGETVHPTTMGNIASGLGLDNMPAGTAENTAPTNTAIAEDKAKTAVEGLLTKADKTLNNVATIGDLQAVAQAGLDFGTNSGDAKDADSKAIATIHKALSSKLEIVGEAPSEGDNAIADDKFSGENVRTFVKDGKVVIRLNKDIKTDSSFVGKDGKNGVSIAGKDGVDGQSGKDGEIKIVKDDNGTKTDVVNIYGKDGVGHIGLNGKDGTSADIFIGKAPADVDGTEITRIKYTSKDANGQDVEHKVATLTDGVKFGGDNTTDTTVDGVTTTTNEVKRKLNERVSIVGGITEANKLTENNIGVVADSATSKLTVKLAKDVRSLTSVGANDKSKVSFDNTADKEAVTITTNDKVLTIKKDGEGISITGLTARNAKDNKADYGLEANANRAATEGALLAIAGNTANDAEDGRNGGNAQDGAAGKDGLNGKDLNEKINALRRGEAGPVVYTDADGKRVVKAKDGKFYLASDVKEDGTVKTADENGGNAPAEIASDKVRLSTVNPNGETTAPTVLANVANGKVSADSKEAVNGSQLKQVYDATGLKVKDDGTVETPALNALTGKDGKDGTAPTNLIDAVNNLTGKVNEGITFAANQNKADTTSGKQQLGSTLTVVKATEELATADKADVKYIGDNLLTQYAKDANGNGTISIALKEKPEFKAITIKDKDDNGNETTVTIGKDGIDAGGKPITNIGDGKNPNDAVNKGQLDQLAAKTGDTSKDGEDGRNGGKGLDGKDVADGKVGPAGKDGLNGQNVNEKVNALRRGEAGPVVYTLADGTRVVKGEDGKLYAKDDLEGKVYVAGMGYIPEAQAEKNADGSYKVKDGETPTAATAKDANTPVVHSLVNYDGNTDKPSVLNNVASGLGLEDKPTAAITADKAKEALNGTTGENAKTGLLAEKGANLNKAATIGDLQAVAQAGLDFIGSNDTKDTIHRALGSTLTLTGEGYTKPAEGKDEFATASGNLRVDADKATNTLTVKLAESLKNIKSIGDDDTSKIAFNKDSKNVVITADDKALTIAKAGEGIKLSGLEARDSVTNEADYGKDAEDGSYANANRAATEGAVRKLSEKLGGKNIGKDGKDGKDGTDADSAGAQGLTGKDGLNGKDLTTKVNALRNGEAGAVVYTDENGNRLVKANDGKYYPTAQVKEDGSVVDNATPATTVIASVVNPNGETTAPTALGNVASGLGLTGKSDDKGNPVALGENEAPVKINEKAAQVATTKLLDLAGADKLNRVSTIGDLQAVAQAGLNFAGNSGTVVHRALSTTLNVMGESSTTDTALVLDKTAKDNIDVVANGTDKLTIRLAAALKNIESLESKVKDAETVARAKLELADDGVKLTHTNGKDQSATLTIARDENATGENAGAAVTGLAARNADDNADYGIKDRAATEAALKKVADKLGNSDKDKDDGRNGGKNLDGTTNADGKVGPAGQDGLNGQNANDKVNALRRGEAGSVVYTLEDGTRVVKGEDGKAYKPADLENKVYVDGKGYVEAEKGADGKLVAKENGAVATPLPADSKLVHSLVNYDGSTTKPSELTNVASGLGLDNMKDDPATSKAITAEQAQKAVAGEDGKSGLLAKEGKDLNKAATVGDLQALAQAGLDFAGNDEKVNHSTLGKQINIVGEGVGKDDTFNSATGNLKVTGKQDDKGNTTLTVALSKDLKNIESVGKDDNNKVSFGTDNVVVKANGAELTITKDTNGNPADGSTDKTTGVSITGLAHRTAENPTSADYGVGNNAGRAATEGAVLEVSKRLGNTSTDGEDGRNGGGNGATDGKGAAGKDGLNGESINDKVNALRRGEAGSVVYTDQDGNRVVKGQDGEFYKPADLKDKVYVEGKGYVEAEQGADGKLVAKTDGAVAQAVPADSNVVHSLVNADGSTTNPSTLGNVKDNLVAVKVDGENGAKVDSSKPQDIVKDLVGNADRKDLHNAATVGDLKTLAQAGLDFVGNDGEAHRNLGTTLNIKGTDKTVSKDDLANKYSADNLATEVTTDKDGNAVVTVKMKKDAEFDSLVLSAGDDKPTLTIDTDGKGNATIAKNKVDDKGQPVVDADGNPVKDVKTLATTEDLANSGWKLNKATADDLLNAKVLTDDEKIKPDDRVVFANGKSTEVVVSKSKDGLAIVTVNADIPMTWKYTDDKGKEYVKAGDGNFYAKDQVDSGTNAPKENAQALTADETAKLNKDAVIESNKPYVSAKENETNLLKDEKKQKELNDKVAAAEKAAEDKVKDTLKGLGVTDEKVIAGAVEKAKEAAKSEAKEQFLADNKVTATGGQTLGGIAKAEKGDQAVNLDQLNDSGWKLNSAVVEGTNGKVISGNTDATKVRMDESVNINAGHNIEITRNGRDLAIGMTRNPEFDKIKTESLEVTKGISIGQGDNVTHIVSDKEGITLGGNPDANGNIPARKIQNVAAGTKDTDAVNVGQLKDFASATNNRMNRIERNHRTGMAAAMAASALPQVYLPGKSMLTASAGTYKGAGAVAVGYSKASDSGRYIFKLNGTANSQGEVGAGVGVGIQW